MKEQHDERQGYCRMLGHTLSFTYCRTMNGGLPCHNVLNCWFERFEVTRFIGENYSEEEIHAIFRKPKTRMATLAEVVARVEKEKKKP